MNTFNLSDYLLPWALRLLRKSPQLTRLLKKDDFGDPDVATWLGMDTLPSNTYTKRKAHFNDLCKKHLSDDYIIEMPGNISRNFDAFAKQTEFNRAEMQILKFLVLRNSDYNFHDAISLVKPITLPTLQAWLSEVLELSVEEIGQALSSSSALVASGLVKVVNERKGLEIVFTQRQIAEPLLSEDCSLETIIRTIVRICPPATLSKADFEHIKDMMELMRPYLKSALRKRQTGVNLFLYGEPGTGKSELARTLAMELNAKLYEVSFEDDDGDATSGKHRLYSLRLAQRFLSRQKALLVFDEAEDIFGGATLSNRDLASQHKAWMNRMLETNQVPTIWISNSIHGLDPAFVRRFDLVYEIKSPARPQRKRIIKKICGTNISTSVMDQLAEEEHVTPAIVARAHTVTHQSCQRKPQKRDQAMLSLIKNTLKAQGHKTKRLESGHTVIPDVYDLSLLNADMDLWAVSDALSPQSSCRICLYGPPGTGKTSFGHWLAQRLETSLHVRKASDILAPFLGLSERNIARCFSEASEEKRILMLDEVDSFLQDRRDARHSWETTLTNELLTQMERFSGIFIASTNLMDNLDQAALRRFDLKIRVGYLKPSQMLNLASSWGQHLELTAPSPRAQAELQNLTNATPGDFANVARQHPFRQFKNTDAFIEAVRQECLIKNQGPIGRLGFITN